MSLEAKGRLSQTGVAKQADAEGNGGLLAARRSRPLPIRSPFLPPVPHPLRVPASIDCVPAF